MNIRYAPETAVVIVELGLVILQYLEPSQIKGNLDSVTATVAVVNIQLGVLVFYIALRGIITSRQLSKGMEELNNIALEMRRGRSSVRSLHEQDFHKEFGEKVKRAKNIVSVAHLDTNPPQLSSSTDVGRYFSNLVREVKKRPEVVYERIEVASQKKREWIERLVRGFDNCTNVSIRCLSAFSEADLKSCVSVQLIDDTDTYLVAVSMHSRPDRPRDMHIHDVEINEIWRDYYKNVLWLRAVPVLENGKPNRENLSILFGSE
jgi:predicted fused transcriptional regulator/phosphomethylpyrimidine kinase